MKSTGIVRKLDELGRITLPIELRRNLNISERDPLEIFVDDERIILKKYQPCDIFTGDMEELIDYQGKKVPAYHLKKSDRAENRCVPPMLEGIDDMNGKTAGIFESGAKTYSDSKFIVNSVCKF